MDNKIQINQIIQDDCIKVLRDLPNNCIDLIITDPPYGDDVAYGFNNKIIRNNKNPLVNCSALAEFYRILKKDSSVYVFTNWKHYPFLTEFIIRYTKFKIRHLIVWKKHNFGLGWAFRHQYELVLVLEKGKSKYNLTNFSNVQTCSHINHNKENHPHQKPVDLIVKIIEHSSKEGDLILDPFLVEVATFNPISISSRYLRIKSESYLLISGMPFLDSFFHLMYLSLCL